MLVKIFVQLWKTTEHRIDYKIERAAYDLIDFKWIGWFQGDTLTG